MKNKNQLSLFEAEQATPPDNKQVESTPWRLFIDGASRNNPGPSGVGIHLIKDDTPVLNKGFYVGTKTNNQAEYLGLIIGVFLLENYMKPFDHIQINADSQLLVRQMQGIYKIKNPALKRYTQCAKKLLEAYNHTFNHVVREKNVMADALANKGVDNKIILPTPIITHLKDYDILV